MSGLSVNQKVMVWARGKLGRPVGKGECWDLAEVALKQANAMTSNDHGPVTEDADYVWGDSKELKDVEPGDILQFRDHEVTEITVTKYTFPDGSWSEDTVDVTTPREHHTAIVDGKLDAEGAVRTLEQNVEPKGRVVQKQKVFTRSLPSVTRKSREKQKNPSTKKLEMADVTTVVTVTVSGTIWAYKPKSK
jgi:hypothetical protein